MEVPGSKLPSSDPTEHDSKRPRRDLSRFQPTRAAGRKEIPHRAEGQVTALQP
jgi:hypothetical protein